MRTTSCRSARNATQQRTETTKFRTIIGRKYPRPCAGSAVSRSLQQDSSSLFVRKGRKTTPNKVVNIALWAYWCTKKKNNKERTTSVVKTIAVVQLSRPASKTVLEIIRFKRCRIVDRSSVGNRLDNSIFIQMNWFFFILPVSRHNLAPLSLSVSRYTS